jgi:DNA-binding beta-propeller fold protein YncE
VKGWLAVLICALSLTGLSGCAAGKLSDLAWQEPGVNLVWPEAPETPRIRYLRTLTGAGDFREETKQSRLFRWVTGEKDQDISFVSPYGVTADGEGRVWVTDTGAGLVHFFDLNRRRVEYWGQAGKQAFVSPGGIVLDRIRKRLYVSDSVLNQVFMMSLEGELQGTLQSPGGFGRPAGMAMGPQGDVYVADVLKGVVEVFTSAGVYRSTIGSRAAPGAGFNRPANLWIDPSGKLFVVDSFNFRVEMIGADGAALGVLGAIGDVPGTFARPRGVALDSQGHVYVADATLDNVQIFDQTGQLLLRFGQRGVGPGEFSLPAGLCFDGDDRLYVVDAHNRRVQVFQYLRLGEEK